MVQPNRSDLSALVGEYRSERATYLRHWILWLGVGSAGGEIALTSLAAALPNPDHAFRIFLPSLWAFLIGVVTAAICLLFASFRADMSARYFAETHNSDELSRAAKKIPEIITAPEYLATQANVERNKYIAQAKKSHDRAEYAWKGISVWGWIIAGSMALSGISFVGGVMWPLIYVSFGGALIP